MKEKIGRNDPCPCGKLKLNGNPIKYKYCCMEKDRVKIIPQKVIDELVSRVEPPEPFEKGGFLVGRHFIDEIFQGTRVRAVGNTIYRRTLDETFHIFLFRRLSEILGQEWFESEQKKPRKNQHPIVLWFDETNKIIESTHNPRLGKKVISVEFTGNMKALLSIAYDFYSLQHCSANVLPKLLNRLKNINQFQGARYEIAVGGLVVRSGFDIKWVNDEDKHCEFIGIHKVTGDKVAFEAKSHHRDGVLGRPGSFDIEAAKLKIFDHLREALEQSPKDIPLVLFDDLNLPITPEDKVAEAKWFNEIDAQLKRANFYENYKKTQYGALLITNFSYHFHSKLPNKKSEVVAYFHTGGKFSLKPETVLQYLKLASEQYGFVPAKAEEFQQIDSNGNK